MGSRCPTCGANVSTIFEHVDIECRPIVDAPLDGTVILGLYSGDQRQPVLWKNRRSHPGGGGSMGAGWVDEENEFPADAPDAWAQTEDA